MNVPIKRKIIYGQTWFELVNNPTVFIDQTIIEKLQEQGHTIIDVDALVAEAVRNN